MVIKGYFCSLCHRLASYFGKIVESFIEILEPSYQNFDMVIVPIPCLEKIVTHSLLNWDFYLSKLTLFHHRDIDF